jgi:hypothetical protein
MAGYASLLRVVVVCASGVVAACGQSSPKYHIAYAGADPETDVSGVDATEIDLAAEHAAAMMGGDPASFADHGTVVYLHRGPIHLWGEKMYGSTKEYVVQTELFPCLFDRESALMHELIHTLFYQQRGAASADPYDNQHTDAVWHRIAGQQAELRARVCPGTEDAAAN